jgi:pyruvate/oxaloacetate carboxyltransferase
MRSDAEMSHPLEGIAMAIAQLSPTDRETLVKMIREYLTSKGVDLTKYAEKREEIRDIKKETRDDTKEIKKESKTEIIAIRTKAQESLRIKREEMRAKIKAL